MKDTKVIGLVATRFVNGIIESIGIWWAVHYILSQSTALESLPSLGTTTLGIYILHQWILARIHTWGGLDNFDYSDAFCALPFDCYVHKTNPPAQQVLLGRIQIDDGRMMAL